MESSCGEEGKSCAFSVILRTLKRPVIIILIVGLLIRFVLAPLFTYTYDITHWAMVMSHIQAGFGLYQVPGYYYSPVWGYMLGTTSLFSNFVFHLQPMVNFFDSLLPVQDLWWYYFTPQVTTITFSVFIKAPMIISDVIVGALIYYLIKDKTGDEKKATYGFALWFLCPIVIWMSSVQAMFDSFSVLFLLLSVILVYKGHYLTGGALLSIAVFTKFFPFYVVFAMIAYIMLKGRDDKAAMKKNLLMGAAGLIIMTVILHIPMIMEGTLTDSLYFMLSRAESAGASGDSLKDFFASLGYLMVIVLQPFIMAFAVYLAYRLTKSRNEDAENLFIYCLLITTAAVFIWIPAPQYLMIIIPFLAYHIAVSDKRYFWPWLLMTGGATIFAFMMNNFSIFTALAAYTHVLNLGWVTGIMTWIQQPIFGTSALFILNNSTGFIEAIGIWAILYIWLIDKIKRRTPL